MGCHNFVARWRWSCVRRSGIWYSSADNTRARL